MFCLDSKANAFSFSAAFRAIVTAYRFCDVMRVVADRDLWNVTSASFEQALKLLLPGGSL